MSNRYAEKTTVTSETSRGEIERILSRYGATSFMYAWQEQRAMIAFQMEGRQIRFNLPMPDKNEHRFKYSPTRGLERSQQAQMESWEQACRQAWRALALVIKAKLEAVEAGITVFEDEFLAHIQLPNGTSVGDWMRPQLEGAYASGNMPPLLPGPRE
ncbi:MAG: hypothetical protein HC888_11255 [Candidatus Competibacteraceae bacterium]|nr:hypothetical protein [Candidatus Competibacteraceae bacterium]